MQRPALGRWWSVAWWIMAAGSVILALMHLWAQTVGRYTTGLIPPEYGIYIGHAEIEKGLLLLLLLVMSLVWLCGVAVLAVYALARHRHLAPLLIWQAIVLLVALGLPLVPSGMWDELLVSTVGPGKAGGRFLGNAAAKGDVARLRKLLDMGVAVDAPNAAGNTESTALVEAVRLGRHEAVALLLQRGADPNHSAIIDKPLLSAVRAGNVALVRMLVEHGANPCMTRVWFTGRGERNEVSVQALANDEVRAVLPPCQKSSGNEK